jgi:hypothetical protein
MNTDAGLVRIMAAGDAGAALAITADLFSGDAARRLEALIQDPDLHEWRVAACAFLDACRTSKQVGSAYGAECVRAAQWLQTADLGNVRVRARREWHNAAVTLRDLRAKSLEAERRVFYAARRLAQRRNTGACIRDVSALEVDLDQATDRAAELRRACVEAADVATAAKRRIDVLDACAARPRTRPGLSERGLAKRTIGRNVFHAYLRAH